MMGQSADNNFPLPLGAPAYPVDLHAHTLFSRCGLHSIQEILRRAGERGLKGQALTDHGPIQGGQVNSVFWERLDGAPGALADGVRLLKGMECNLQGSGGAIDFPRDYLPFADVILLGYHANTPSGRGAAYYTDRMIRALDRNPWVDLVTHPADPGFPMDYRALARFVRSSGRLLEVNNSKVHLKRVDPADFRRFLEVCGEEDCPVAVNTDAHALNEVGDTRAADAVLREVAFPRRLIMNREEDILYPWLDSRRAEKTGLPVAESKP